jgi:hypothetical protein
VAPVLDCFENAETVTDKSQGDRERCVEVCTDLRRQSRCLFPIRRKFIHSLTSLVLT